MTDRARGRTVNTRRRDRLDRGTLLGLWVATLGIATACATARPIRPSPEPVTLRHLVVMLDGVPWPLVDSLWNEGHFRGFRRPSRLISTFPSITGVAFRDIWHEPFTPGYEDRYYDRDRRRVAGGLLDHVFAGGDERTFHDHVDVMADGVTAGLAYLVPVTRCR